MLPPQCWFWELLGGWAQLSEMGHWRLEGISYCRVTPSFVSAFCTPWGETLQSLPPAHDSCPDARQNHRRGEEGRGKQPWIEHSETMSQAHPSAPNLSLAGNLGHGEVQSNGGVRCFRFLGVSTRGVVTWHGYYLSNISFLHRVACIPSAAQVTLDLSQLPRILSCSCHPLGMECFAEDS